jgi:6-phospho-3-hexuloisomerase
MEKLAMPDIDAKTKAEATLDSATNELVTDTMETISDHLVDVSRSLDLGALDEFARMLNAANRIFVMGAGRSGLVARSFAMRLMHIGYQVYVVGEIVTPAVTAGDVVVAISGSGNTRTISEFGEI